MDEGAPERFRILAEIQELIAPSELPRVLIGLTYDLPPNGELVTWRATPRMVGSFRNKRKFWDAVELDRVPMLYFYGTDIGLVSDGRVTYGMGGQLADAGTRYTVVPTGKPLRSLFDGEFFQSNGRYVHVYPSWPEDNWKVSAGRVLSHLSALTGPPAALPAGLF